MRENPWLQLRERQHVRRHQTSVLVPMQVKVAIGRNHNRRDMKAIPHQTSMKLQTAHCEHLEIDKCGKVTPQRKYGPRFRNCSDLFLPYQGR